MAEMEFYIKKVKFEEGSSHLVMGPNGDVFLRIKSSATELVRNLELEAVVPLKNLVRSLSTLNKAPMMLTLGADGQVEQVILLQQFVDFISAKVAEKGYPVLQIHRNKLDCLQTFCNISGEDWEELDFGITSTAGNKAARCNLSALQSITTTVH